LVPAHSGGGQAQLLQITFRCWLIDMWQFQPGERVLGCGQGDATAGLADRVGPSGSVLAIDPALRAVAHPSRSALLPTGAPLHTGRANDHSARQRDRGHRRRAERRLAESRRVRNCGDDSRAVVRGVRERLLALLGQEAGLAPTLCLSGASTRVRRSSSRTTPRSRCTPTPWPWSVARGQSGTAPMSRVHARDTVIEAGWIPVSEDRIDTRELHDGQWERATASAVAAEAIDAATERTVALLGS
jgi:hypothetical protein